MTMIGRGSLRRGMCAASMIALAAGLGGCAMPNSSNPTLSITRSQVSGASASLQLRIDNPSDYDLTLSTIDWTLVHGPTPVASGRWDVNELLESGSSVAVSRRIRFDRPTLDPSSSQVELRGTMNFGQSGGIRTAAFNASGG